ncbi:hypothetical protein VTK56DRAFT_7256 [Thermocarpiscus australiensis]
MELPRHRIFVIFKCWCCQQVAFVPVSSGAPGREATAVMQVRDLYRSLVWDLDGVSCLSGLFWVFYFPACQVQSRLAVCSMSRDARYLGRSVSSLVDRAGRLSLWKLLGSNLPGARSGLLAVHLNHSCAMIPLFGGCVGLTPEQIILGEPQLFSSLVFLVLGSFFRSES